MTLILRPIEANLTHDTEAVERMDPYVKIFLGGQQFKTSVCKEGGRHPFWNDTIRFGISSNDTTIRIQVWDDDTFSDDFVGQGSYNIQQLRNYQSNRTDNEWIDLSYKGRPAGRILMSMEIAGMNNMIGGNMGMGINTGGYNNYGNNGGWNQQQPMNNGGWNQQQPMNNGGFGMQPPINGGFGIQPPMNGGFGMQPPNNGWGVQPPNNGWGMQPPNNGWNNNGW